MAGTSPIVAAKKQGRGLADPARSQDRGEAARARADLLTPAGRTSPAIAVAFGVRQDTARLRRSAFMRGGLAALRAHIPLSAIIRPTRPSPVPPSPAVPSTTRPLSAATR